MLKTRKNENRMNDMHKYLEILFEIAQKGLNTYFEIDSLGFDKFGIINSYLIYQTIKGGNKEKNTLIYIPDKETKSQFYIPTILILSLYDFIDNYIDDKTDFKKGDIVQKNGERYEITKIANNTAHLKKHDVSNTKIEIKKDVLKRYIITTANLKSKVRAVFEFYKKLFGEVLKDELDYLPSKFKYKSVIITDKNIVNELKKYEVDGNKIHKAFPFQYITKSGKKSDNIPIDPMTFIANDLPTAKEHILDNGQNIRNLIFIGANKYKEYHLDISHLLNNQIVENCIFIGSADYLNDAIPNLKKWKWTLSELDYFSYFETYPINDILAEDETFNQQLTTFNETVISIEECYGLSLKELYKFVRYLLPVVIPSNESRLCNQLDNNLTYFENEGEDIVRAAFYEIDEYDYEDDWEKILDKFKPLIEHKKSSSIKYQKLNEFDRIDYLVVPKEYLAIWQEEIRGNKIRNLITFKEFEGLDKKNKVVVFLGFYGYKHLKSILYSSNKINVIVTHQEKEHYDNCSNRFKKETYQELRNEDRKSISGISFKETEEAENISELLKRLFEQPKMVKSNPDYPIICSENILYIVAFENETEPLLLDESKTVLLKLKKKEREEKVKNLKAGDCIRVYDNSSKETLYQIATDADEENNFQGIEDYAKIWKRRLSDYGNRFDTTETFLQNLQEHGISITSEATLRSWTNENSRIKFPQSRKDLVVIKKVTEMDEDVFKEIIRHRQAYNSIMIALGRDLSDEVSDYIKSKKKGKILKQFSEKQILTFVNKNAPARTIKTIKVFDNE